jgi:nitroimidazol reductase NimA-like FMN-containing flavoprotein (pyridoxamine 5'-phosphate oxidase superfamily)
MVPHFMRGATPWRPARVVCPTRDERGGAIAGKWSPSLSNIMGCKGARWLRCNAQFGEVPAMDPAIRQEILSILAGANDLTIATVREDGYPQATTVSYVSDDLAIYFGAATASQKAANIAHSNKVSLTINLPYSSWDEIRGVSVGGRAQRVTDPKEMEHAGQLMLKKFPQVAQYAPAGIEGLEGIAVFRVTPEVISVLDYRKGFGHMELVKV